MAGRTDYLGNPATVASDRTLAAIDDFVGGFLGYETRALGILDAADADPGCCLANLYAAALHMLLEAPAAPCNAAPYLLRAEAASAGATERERHLVRFVRLWQQDEIPAARELGEAIAADFPRDLALVKLHQYLSFNLGDAPAMLRIASAVEPFNQANPHLLGMLAFAYEQCHLIDEAEGAAERALALQRREPWAQHALAHVALARGRTDAGAALLESMQDSWAGLNSFMLTHLWWHQCLFHLSQGRWRRALEIYDTQCCGVDKSYSQDQIGAVSLLARLELSGADIGGRWHDLAPYLALRAGDTTQPFLTLQYLYGLAKAGRDEADDLLRAIRDRAETAPDFVRPVWRDLAMPTASALVAHARGNFAVAVAGLRLALPLLARIGGSHAQRDLFDQIFLDALIRSGEFVEAQQMLERRRQTDPLGVPVNRALAQAYTRLRLPREAARAAARADATQAAHLA